MTSAQLQFEQFHGEHPEVYDCLVRYARSARDVGGFSHFGIHTIWERMRWYVVIEHGISEFKLNNNHTPYYARLIMQREPDLAGFFETRVMKHGEPDLVEAA